MNASRKMHICNCHDDEPGKCFDIKQMDAGKKPIHSTVHYMCSCPCHAEYLDGDTDIIKG